MKGNANIPLQIISKDSKFFVKFCRTLAKLRVQNVLFSHSKS